MKAEIQKIGAGEKGYYNVTIDGVQMGVFKFLSDNDEWRYSASDGSKSLDQMQAINWALGNVCSGCPEINEAGYKFDPDCANKPVKGD